ncbi:DsbA family protein [Chloroflexi bacterium TSY]|nr:DsbA family protein [Chloroflexi bacterium TSY]
MYVGALFFASLVFISGCAAEEFSPTLQPDIDATVEAAVNATVEALTANGGEAEEVAEGNETQDTATMLITPTPDHSAEIMEMIIQNTRHFKGNPDAPVVIVEFSDFL